MPYGRVMQMRIRACCLFISWFIFKRSEMRYKVCPSCTVPEIISCYLRRLRRLRPSSRFDSSTNFHHNSGLSDPKMKTFSIYTAMTVLLTAFAHAAPTHAPDDYATSGYPPSTADYATQGEPASGPLYIQITFQGAPPNVAFYEKAIPADGSIVNLSTPT